MSGSTLWFIKHKDQIQGPFTSTTLRSMVKRGDVISTSEIGQSATGPWYPASRIKGLILEHSEYKVPSLNPDSVLEERNRLIDGEAWKRELLAISWKDLFPLAAWFRDEPWTLVWVQALVFAFAFPLFLLQWFSNRAPSLFEAAFAFSSYFAILWAILLHRLLRPERIGIRKIAAVWLSSSTLGVVAVVFLTVLASFIPGLGAAIAATESASIVGRFFGMTFGVGLIEESVKLFVVYFLFTRDVKTSKPVNSIVFMGVISGLAFGATEAIAYSYDYVDALLKANVDVPGYMVVQILRFISLPFLHAIWCGTSAYFLALAVASQASQRMLPMIGVATVALLHGSYNTYSDSWIGFAISVLSMFVFVGYVRTGAAQAIRSEDL